MKANGKYHIVRMLGKTDARTRSVKEADRMIRVRLLEQRAQRLEHELEQKLRKRFKVTVDKEGLKRLELPKKPK